MRIYSSSPWLGGVCSLDDVTGTKCPDNQEIALDCSETADLGCCPKQVTEAQLVGPISNLVQYSLSLALSLPLTRAISFSLALLRRVTDDVFALPPPAPPRATPLPYLQQASGHISTAQNTITQPTNHEFLPPQAPANSNMGKTQHKRVVFENGQVISINRCCYRWENVPAKWHGSLFAQGDNDRRGETQFTANVRWLGLWQNCSD